MFHFISMAKVPTSLIKHKYVRKEASTPSLKTVHRTVFLTVVFKSRYRFACLNNRKREVRLYFSFSMVRVTGLEPVRQRHTPLKRACLPIPAHSHISVKTVMSFQRCLLYHRYEIKSSVFWYFFKEISGRSKDRKKENEMQKNDRGKSFEISMKIAFG